LCLAPADLPTTPGRRARQITQQGAFANPRFTQQNDQATFARAGSIQRCAQGCALFHSAHHLRSGWFLRAPARQIQFLKKLISQFARRGAGRNRQFLFQQIHQLIVLFQRGGQPSASRQGLHQATVGHFLQWIDREQLAIACFRPLIIGGLECIGSISQCQLDKVRLQTGAVGQNPRFRNLWRQICVIKGEGHCAFGAIRVGASLEKRPHIDPPGMGQLQRDLFAIGANEGWRQGAT